MGHINQICLLYLFIVNLTAFGTFGIDKYKAVRRKFRIPEKTLFLLALLGGAAGAWVGMFIFHHKTTKWKFRIGIPAILVIEIFLVYLTRRVLL